MSTVPMQSPNLDTPFARRGEPAWEVAFLFPDQGSWTEDDYLQLESNRLVEFSDGFLEVLPMPTLAHQLIVAHLYELFSAFVTAARAMGKVAFAPLPVRLWVGKFREPDLIYLRPERVRETSQYPHGSDLALEVVSEGQDNRDRDLVTKPAEYMKAGVTEYWTVDPQLRKISVFVLEGGRYRLHGEYGPGEVATSVLLPGLRIPVDGVFAAGETT